MIAKTGSAAEILHDIRESERKAQIEALLDTYFPHADYCCAKGCPGRGNCSMWAACDGSCKCEQVTARMFASALVAVL